MLFNSVEKPIILPADIGLCKVYADGKDVSNRCFAIDTGRRELHLYILDEKGSTILDGVTDELLVEAVQFGSFVCKRGNEILVEWN